MLVKGFDVSDLKVTDSELYELFEMKYGKPCEAGWSPKRRLKYGYYSPGDVYEATVKKCVNSETVWLDVGGGSAIFPYNTALSKQLAEACTKLVAVDPSENVLDNPYAHEKVMALFEDYQTDDKFDLATFRMVAEHITDPDSIVLKLRELLKPNGIVVIYTINKFSPIPIITYITPFSWHFKIKKFFWGGEERDTFPVAYKMNTRKELKDIFGRLGFTEECFQHLDDLSAFSKFRVLNLLEIWLWKVFKGLGLRYPENNLLGIYKKSD